MSTQPEALRLADLLDGDPNSKAHHDEAADELRRLHAVNAELQELIDGIYIYANDTLSGRVDGPDDRDWQRASVVEIRNRARAFSTVASARAAIAKATEVQSCPTN